MITEANEAASSKLTALENFAAQYAKDETMGVRAMYEQAAVCHGASFDETERWAEVGKLVRAFWIDVEARLAAGDKRAEYHAQRPKVDAYRLLMAQPMSPKEAVATFKRISENVR